MIFMVEFKIDRDRYAEDMKLFANMSDEDIAAECPPNMRQIGRWHDLPNGTGIAIIEATDQEKLTSWLMTWAPTNTFPVIKPVVDDETARRIIKATF